MISKQIIKYSLILGGTISLGLGMIGIFIPVLPTTPFLLLAAFCYLRSSKKLYTWLVNHRIFGTYIYNYMTYKAVKKRVKIVAIIFLWVSLGFSIIVVDNSHLRILLCIIGISVSIHLLRLKTLVQETSKDKL
ncbi:MAG: uncharacterized protein K0R15_930 [Clostridiales bacterium]|jgi:uncharacterized membrane protein YbaN (DUF454 family)|nr:uncharacterized protein [Clostridiales bacterium]